MTTQTWQEAAEAFQSTAQRIHNSRMWWKLRRETVKPLRVETENNVWNKFNKL